MANPRKFSEKIALHNQKQAEETAAFERIMQEVSVTRHPQQRMLSPHSFLRPSLGGSLPNVNQMSGPPMEMPMRQSPYDDFKPPHYRHQLRFDSRPRPYDPNHRRQDMQNRHPRHIGLSGNPHCGTYLSPPPDSSWRSFGLSRTHSDSALHQSVMNPASQETYGQMGNQPHLNPLMPPPHARDMMPLVNQTKLQEQLAGVTRPKSCEDTHMNVMSNTEANHRLGMLPNPTNPGLSHVTQIGNNTGSLPDLTSLHIPSPLSNPIDYDEHQKQVSQNHHPSGNLQSPASMLFNQARSTGNIPAESTVSPHIGGLSRGNPASPNRPRRHTHTDTLSPLIDQSRRLKYQGLHSSKMGVKSELKSPPIGGPYSYQYQGPVHQEIRHHLQHTPNNNHQILRVDVNAASKVGQYSQNHPLPGHRQSTGPNMSSPITSPTSPTSQNSFSPGASPQHLPELTTSGNPALSEAYYRTEPPNMQPLQHEFEQFHFVSDAGMSQTSMLPSGYSNLQLLGDSSFPQSSPFGNQRSSDSSIYAYNNGSNLLYKNLISPTAKIPDIVFTGDDGHTSKVGGETLLYPGADLTSDYFPGDDLKSNFGIEELQMLTEDKLIEDPVMEDELRMNST